MHSYLTAFGFNLFDLTICDIRRAANESSILDENPIENSGIWTEVIPVKDRNTFLHFEHIFCYREEKSFHKHDNKNNRNKLLEKRREVLKLWIECHFK